MLKRQSFWQKVVIFFQLFTAFAHSLSFLNNPQPVDDAEKQMMDLMSNYKINFGNGYHPTMENLMTSFSICFALFFAMGGVLNWYLLKKKVEPGLLKGITGILLIFHAMVFVSTLVFTFLPPIICTALILLSLVMLYIVIPKTRFNATP